MEQARISSNQASQAAQGARTSKGKAAAGGASTEGADDGFSSMLSALGGAASDAEDGGALPSQASDGSGDGAATTVAGDAASTLGAVPGQPDPAVLAALQLQQMVPSVAAAPQGRAAGGRAAQQAGIDRLTDAEATGAVGAGIDASAAEGALEGQQRGGARGFPIGQGLPGDAAQALAMKDAGSAAASTGLAPPAAKRSGTAALNSVAGLSTLQQAQASGKQQQVSSVRGDSRGAADNTAALQQSSVANLAQSAVAAVADAVNGRDGSRESAKSMEASGAVAGGAPTGGASWAAATAAYPAAASALPDGQNMSATINTAQGHAEELVAEQVSYWVNQKTQNAELTLDPGGQKVEVHIALSGNEAQVAFRSDQAQTREMLDASVSHLRELLQGEGLVLSGVSVGASGTDSTGAREGGEQGRTSDGRGVRQAQVLGTAPIVGAGAARATGTTAVDRALDIFV